MLIIIQPNSRKCHFTLLSQGFEKNDKPKRVETQSTYGPNVFPTKQEVSEGDPPTDTKELITTSLIPEYQVKKQTDTHILNLQFLSAELIQLLGQVYSVLHIFLKM